MDRKSLTCFFIAILIAGRIVGQVPGQLADTVTCLNDASEKYSLYLPSTYVPSKHFPLILFLDPGGRGNLPVSKYQALAESHGLILAGSFNARNGPFDRSRKAAYSVLLDVKSRYSIDPSAVILTGFSGGARVAAQVGWEEPMVAAIVACGAFPEPAGAEKNVQLFYSGVVGRGDLNYLEAMETFSRSNSARKNGYLTFFEGEHDWPPPLAFDKSLQWILIQLDRLPTSATEHWSQMIWKDFNQSLDSANSFEFDRQREQLLRWLPVYKSKVDSLDQAANHSKEFLKRKANFNQAIQQEQKWRKNFLENYQQQVAFGAPDSAFHAGIWSTAGKQLQEFSRSQMSYEKWMGRRLDSFSRILLWEGYGNFMSYKQYRQAAAVAKMMTYLDATNSAGSILAARAYAKLNLRDETIRYLDQSLKRGYSKEKLKSENLFSTYLTNRRIVKLLDQKQ